MTESYAERGDLMADTFRSIFDIIGPIMVGPSSSHTAGALTLGKAASQLFKLQAKKENSLMSTLLRFMSKGFLAS